MIGWFTRVESWPTSKKTRLVSGLALLAHLVFICGSALPMSRVPAVDTAAYVSLTILGAAALAIVFVASVVEVALGHEGHWTAYAIVIAYGTWITIFIQAMGSWSTVTWALYPLAVVVIALYFGGGIGWAAFAVGIVLITARELLERFGIVPYAPLLHDGSAPAQPTGAFVAAIATAVFGTYIFCFAFSLLVVSARRHQDLRLRLAHARLERAHGLIRRYVPEQVAEAVMSDTPEAIARHERRKLTIFFSDLVGFTDLSDEMEPEDLALVLHDYFTEMSAIAKKHGGTVDDLIGDAILVLFGAPDFTEDKDQALRAVRMAVEMQEAMEPLNERWASAGIPETLTVRMGINTGVATVGNFGSAERTKYTALGKQVNIAARIQSQCEPGKVLLSHPTWLLIRDQITCNPKGELVLKGLRRPMPAHEVQ